MPARRPLAAPLLACLALCACKAAAPPPPAVCGLPQGSTGDVAGLVSADTSFAVDLYGPAVAAAGTGQDAVMSPFSVSSALTMVDVGAAGETASQMQAVLHLPASGAQLAPAYAALACEDEGDGSSNGNQLSIANAVWAQKGAAFEASFLSALSSGYGAPLQPIDFSDPASGSTRPRCCRCTSCRTRGARWRWTSWCRRGTWRRSRRG